MEEVGPAVEAPNVLVAFAGGCCAALSVDVAGFGAPNIELAAGAADVVVVEPKAGVAADADADAAAPVLDALVAVDVDVAPAAEEGVAAPKRLDAGLAGSVVAVPEAGFPKPENMALVCCLGGSAVGAVVEGLLSPVKSPPGWAATGAAEVAELAGVDEALFIPENNEEELADVVGVVLAPPKRPPRGLAEDASAGLEAC